MLSLSSLRTLLQTPPALRSFLLTPQKFSYHSTSSSSSSEQFTASSPYGEPESSILSKAYAHIPVHGFTPETLTLGAKEAGYLSISTNLFPRGAYELVNYHLITQRVNLSTRVQFSDAKIGVGQKVRTLILERLRANVDTGILPRWQDALALMSLAENIPPSLRELGRLADEIWFLAGDKAVDGSWYTKRASLATVYAATEVFQTTDQSTDGKDTEEFLDRRLEEVRKVGGAVGGTMEWLGFQMGAVVNGLRSKGVRI